MLKKLTLSLLLAAASIGSASATTLGITTNVDNIFNIYVSTSDSALGTLVGSGNNWTHTYNFSSALTAGTTNYIHVVATNQGGPGGFLGAFTLNDAAFEFANGTQNLLTNTTDWLQNTTGFGNAYSAAVGEGNLGTSPWSSVPGYGSSSPRWLWNYVSNNSSDFNTVYFTSTINSVPEPTSMALLGLGLFGLAAMRKRQQK
ncbi:MAG: PEP-CTERM sorting domain-containing protein [Pseudomonadota bacterium]